MKRHIIYTLLSVLLLFAGWGCRNSDLWDDVPSPIAEFINHYFPYSELSSISDNGSSYHIRIDDGPGLTFSSDYSWESIDGYGMPLPQVLLFDQLPPKLYNYIQETEQLNGVFSLERNKDYYLVTLMDTTLKYVIESGELSEVIHNA